MSSETEKSEQQASVREAVDIAMKIRGEVSRLVNGVNPRDTQAVAAYEATCAAATQIYCASLGQKATSCAPVQSPP